MRRYIPRTSALEVENRSYKRRRSPEQKAMLAEWQAPVVATLAEALSALGAKIA